MHIAAPHFADTSVWIHFIQNRKKICLQISHFPHNAMRAGKPKIDVLHLQSFI